GDRRPADGPAPRLRRHLSGIVAVAQSDRRREYLSRLRALEEWPDRPPGDGTDRLAALAEARHGFLAAHQGRRSFARPATIGGDCPCLAGTLKNPCHG